MADTLNVKYFNFCEDDYIWRVRSYEFLIDALKLGYDPVTLYNHPDRYIRDGNGWYAGGTDETHGKDLIGLTNCGYIRTCESTTCSFACSKDFFELTKKDLHYYNSIGVGAPVDREFWRMINKKYGIRLWSAIPGLSCHMTSPLTHHFDWGNL